MKKFNATRTIIQVATIEAESVEAARALIEADSEAVSWEDTSNRFMVFESLEEERQAKQRKNAGPPSHFQQ